MDHPQGAPSNAIPGVNTHPLSEGAVFRWCEFACGISNTHDDFGKPGSKTKWEYENNKGCGCYDCAREYKENHQVKGEKRAAFIARLTSDSAEHTAFIEKSRARAEKRKGRAERSAGQKRQIDDLETYGSQLLPPADDFLPIKEYRKLVPKGFKKGHKQVTAHGVKGVLLPPKELTPWKFQRAFGKTQEKRTRRHSGQRKYHGQFFDQGVPKHRYFLKMF